MSQLPVSLRLFGCTLLLSLLFSPSISGQHASWHLPTADGNEVKRRDASDNRWLGLGIGFSNWIDNDGFDPSGVDYELNMARSIYVDIRPLGRSVSISGNQLTLDYALGIDWYNFFFDNNQVTLMETEEGLRTIERTEDFSKSKLTVTYLYLPLLLHWETKPEDAEHSFRAEAGGYAGFRIGAHTKTKNESGDKTKRYRDFEINDLRYGLEAAIGYGPVNLFAKYDLETLFEEDAFFGDRPVAADPVEIQAVTFGIRISGFSDDDFDKDDMLVQNTSVF